MRRLILGCLALLPNAPAPARAQEPLFLRIQPNDVRTQADSGAPLSDEEIAARARAAREAVWQRAERRAHLAIASVCRGCLKEGASETAPPTPPIDAVSTAAPKTDSMDGTEAAATAGAAPLSLADSR